MARKRAGRELWQRLVEQFKDDLGPSFESPGAWTARKLFFVCQYLERVATGMHGNPAFPGGLTYVDLFCGKGLANVRMEDGSIRRYPGSPVIAASTPKPFGKLVLVDRDAGAINALKERVVRTGYTGVVEYRVADCNVEAAAIASAIPLNSLNVCFVDPYSLDVHYRTIEAIAKQRAIDLIILFSDRFDLGRNVRKYYYPDEELSKLDLFLGTREWRSEMDALTDHSGARIRQFFADVYLRQLLKLGYSHAQSWPLDGPNGPSFRLVFASKHPLGLKYCNIALGEDFEGNASLFSA